MRRSLASLVAVAAIAAGCARTPEPQGPTGPGSLQDIAVDDLRLAGQARSVAAAFLEAYAASPTDSGGALRPLVDGVLAREWVHWLDVQHRGFPGTVEGSLQLEHLGPAGPVRAEDGSLDDVVAYGVVVRASVVFALTDEGGSELPSVTREMDGLIVLVRGEDGAFRVLNFVRDGLRLDEFFQVFEGAQERRAGVTVEIENLIQLERWQFGVRITNGTKRSVHVLPDLTALIDADEQPMTEGPPFTALLDRIPAGASAEGIVSFAPPTETNALDLQIAVAGPDGDATGFVFGVPEPAVPTAET